MTPKIGAHVLYTLSAEDVAAIDQRRAGNSQFAGNQHSAGDECAAVIVRTYADMAGSPPHASLQVFLDGNDSYWATSRQLGEGEGFYQVPPAPGEAFRAAEEARRKARWPNTPEPKTFKRPE